MEFHVTPLFFGNPKSRRRRRRRKLCFCLRLVVATPHVVPPPPLALLALCRLLSADASPPFCLLYVSPPIRLFFCQLVVASPLLSRPCQLRLETRNFALTSSLPSGYCNLQCPTYRATDGSRPLAASALQLAASASRHIAASQLAVSWSPSPMRRRHCRQCAGVFAVIAIAIVALGDCHPHHLSSSWCYCHRRHCCYRIPSRRCHRRQLRCPLRRRHHH